MSWSSGTGGGVGITDDDVSTAGTSGDGLASHSHWPLPVVVALVLACMLVVILLFARHYRRTKGADWNIPQSDLWIPLWSVSPLALLVFRVVIFLYTGILQLHQFITIGSRPLIFYTIWNFCLLIAFFGLGSWISISALFRRSGDYQSVDLRTGTATTDSSDSPMLNRRGYVFVFLFQLCFTMVFLVDSVYWGVLYPQGTIPPNFAGINQHGLNMLFMLIEFSMSRLHFYPWNASLLLLWPCLFAMVTWITHSVSGKWPYDFMEYEVDVAPLWYVGLMVGHLGFFAFATGLDRLKHRLAGTAPLDHRAPFIVPARSYGAEFA